MEFCKVNGHSYDAYREIMDMKGKDAGKDTRTYKGAYRLFLKREPDSQPASKKRARVVTDVDNGRNVKSSNTGGARSADDDKALDASSVEFEEWASCEEYQTVPNFETYNSM